MALLGALVLLALSAALATAIFSAAHAARLAAGSARARVRVDAGIRRAFAEVLQHWGSALDSIPVGAASGVSLESEPAADGLPLIRFARVDRVTDRLYAITVDVRAASLDHPLAHRRARLWLERATADSVAGAPIPPVVVTPWGFTDLY